jgi:hypothetical protein
MFRFFSKNKTRKNKISNIGFSKLDYIGISIMLIVFVVSVFFVLYSLFFD